MTLTIGTGAFDVAEVDYKGIDWKYRTQSGFSIPSTPIVKASYDLARLHVRKVADYDCKTQTASFFHTQPDRKILLSPWVSIIGVNAKGQNTSKADKALADSFAKATGKLSVTDTVAEIFKLFGQRSIDIPFNAFVKEFGADRSWTIYMTVNWVMVKLALPKGTPSGLVCIGVPYDVNFSGGAYFDCKRGRPIRVGEAREFEAGFAGFPIRSPDIRQFAVADLEWRIKEARRSWKWLRQQAVITREMFPDPEDAKGIKTSEKRAIRRAKAELDRLKQFQEELSTE